MASTVEAFSRMLAGAIRPLLDALDSGADSVLNLGAELGWILPDPPPPAFADLADPIELVVTALHALEDAEVEGTANDVAEAFVQLAVATVALTAELNALPGRLATELDPGYVAATNIDDEILDRLYGFVVADAIADHAPRAYGVLTMAGLIEDVVEPEDLPAFQPEYRRRTLRWDRVPAWLEDPAGVVGELYGWGTPAIDIDRVFDAMMRLGFAIATPPTLERPSAALLAVLAPGVDPDGDDIEPSIVLPFYDLGGGAITLSLAITPLPMLVPGPQPLAFTLRATGLASFTIPLYPGATIALEAATDLSSGFGLVLRPGQAPAAIGSLDTGAAFESGRASARFTYDGEDAIDLLTVSSDVGLQADSLFLGCGVQADAGSVEPFVEGGIVGGSLVVRRGAADGLLGALLPEDGIEAAFAFAARWSPSGLALQGSGGLETSIPINQSAGPFRIDSVDLRIAADAAALTAEVAVSGGGSLGPLTIFLDRVGVAFDVAMTPGNLGPADLSVDFKPPSGGALALTAGPMSGGGLLIHDAAARRYTGAARVTALGVEMNAFTVIETGGAVGFSGALVISAEFAPVQIGFGFTLDGVGGMIGINRRVDVDALRAAVRGPGMTDVFFPSDPFGQAARLSADLASYFPAARGRHVFGPAVRLGWGTPTLLRGTLALLMEVPAPVRLVLLGTVSAKLPIESEPIIELNVDVVGEVDFARKTGAIDASLRDSKVAGFAITGDLALRTSWGDSPSFVLSIGGFHSQFRPPPGFPALRRVHIPIGAGENPRIDVQGFLALTSNTAQVGASLDLYAAAGPLNIVGSLGFEALIQFVPFAFEVDLWAGVALRRGTRVLAGVHLDGKLRGPTPWHFSGEACLSLWFVDLCVDFDATFGEPRAIELPQLEIWPQLEAALEDPRSWSTAMPPAGARAVVTAPPRDELAAPTRIDPAATLSVRQKVAPLNRKIERFSEAAPLGTDRFDVTGAQLGAVPLLAPPLLDDWFAPAQFEELSDAERLSRPGYERMVAGVSIAGDQVTTGAQLLKSLDYETIKFPDPEPLPGFHRPTMVAQLAGNATSANAAAPLRPPAAPVPLVTLAEETFVIASTDDLVPRLDLVGPVGRGVAELALKAYLAANPAQRGAYQVVPRFEVEGLMP